VRLAALTVVSPVVGREAERAAIEELLTRATRRRTLVLDIAGEPGIGKTRLLRETLDRARARGFTCCAGHGSELERELPHALLADLFAPVAAGGGRMELGPLAAQLAPVLGVAPPPGSAPERHRIGRAVARLVELLAGQAPLMIAVDDLHWADAASVGVLAHVIDRVDGVPVVLAFASRRGARPAALAAALRRREPTGDVTRIELGPLSPGQADQLLGRELEAPVREALMRESGGNPFYLEQLARTVGHARERAGAEPLVTDVPRAVALALAGELGVLDGGARCVAHALAVAGDGADPDLVAAVAARERAATLQGLDDLVDADIVRQTGETPGFAFRHPIVRRAVYDDAGAAWRIEAHRRALVELGRRGAPAARRAHHAEHAAAPGDGEAIALLAEAASGCLTVAPATAARYYRAALRLLPGDEAGGDTGLALRVPLALALAAAGAMEDSREALRDVLAALPPEAGTRRARVVTSIVAIEHLLGRYDEARDLLARERGLRSPAARGALAQSLASHHYFAGAWGPMLDAASEAHALATEAGAHALQAEAAATAGLAAAALARRDDATAWLDAARAVFADLPDARLVAHLNTASWLGLCELHLGHYARARRVLERGDALARRTGQDSAAVQISVALASVCALTGRLADGRRAASYAVDVARLLGVPNVLGWAEIARCWIALLEGRLDEALEAGDLVERAVSDLGTPALSGGVCALAEARVLSGDPRHARDALLRAAGTDLCGLAPLLRTWACAILTQAELRMDAPERAAAWAAQARESAARLGLDRDRSFAALADARVALAVGDRARAATAALASADAADASGGRLYGVEARLVAGLALAPDDPDRAAALLDAAHDTARACGALGVRNEVARALAALGRRPRGGAAASSHLLGVLSPREREIAELVADRLRNREIAERLHVSEKTVERHVSHVLAKLGVGSRVEVARAVDRDRASR
jgi:DNA-binding CsgD family transcriptional regulator